MSTTNGPAAGGNILVISCVGLGNGSDITNVTVCGIAAGIQSQTADVATVVVGSGGSGNGDIEVYSASRGLTTIAQSYTYNPPGYVAGPFVGWASVSNLPGAREALAAVSVNGKIYAIGGWNGDTDQRTVYVYDPAQPTRGWLSVSNLPGAREDLAAVSLNGKIYVMGGDDDTGGDGFSNGIQSTVYVYDPAQPTQGWLSVSNLPRARAALAAVSLNGKIYVMGGEDYVSAQSTGYIYSPAQPGQGWVNLSSMPAARRFFAAASANGKIYVMGGDDTGSDDSPQATVYVYDPMQPTQGWQSATHLPKPLFAPAGVSVNGKIYIIGGDDTGSDESPQTTVYMYDPAQPNQGWLSVANLPAPREYLAAASVNGEIFVIGGWDGTRDQPTVYASSHASGVTPGWGPLTGGNRVTISGENLGSGDITNVTLCGIPAVILADDSPTQIVIRAGAAAFPVTGDVVVGSTSYGVTVASNAYTYLVAAVTAAFDGRFLRLSWPRNCLGCELQTQTNAQGVGQSTNWCPVAGSTTTNQTVIPIDPAIPSVFYRLHCADAAH